MPEHKIFVYLGGTLTFTEESFYFLHISIYLHIFLKVCFLSFSLRIITHRHISLSLPFYFLRPLFPSHFLLKLCRIDQKTLSFLVSVIPSHFRPLFDHFFSFLPSLSPSIFFFNSPSFFSIFLSPFYFPFCFSFPFRFSFVLFLLASPLCMYVSLHQNR